KLIDVQHAGDKEHDKANDDHGCADEYREVLALGKRVCNLVPGIFNGLLTHGDVLEQADGHHDGRSTKAPVEALPAPQCVGDQRAEQTADIHTHVVDGEATVTAGIIAIIEL